MPKFTPVDWRAVECVFLKAGLRFARQEGSHRSYVKDGITRPVVIPTYREVPVFIIPARGLALRAPADFKKASFKFVSFSVTMTLPMSALCAESAARSIEFTRCDKRGAVTGRRRPAP